MTIGFIGAGNMARAMISGLLAKRQLHQQILSYMAASRFIMNHMPPKSVQKHWPVIRQLRRLQISFFWQYRQN